MRPDVPSDLWRPLDDLTLAEALDNIFPIQAELNSVITREHLIDDLPVDLFDDHCVDEIAIGVADAGRV